MISAQDFKAGMRRLPAAVTIVTCRLNDGSYGLTATAVCSLSSGPPSLVACVNREASAHRAIVETKAFCVNILPHDRVDLARLFASARPEDRARRFAGDDWGVLTTGAPVLKDAIVAFDCRLDQCVDYATHSILIGQVEDMQLGSPTKHLMYIAGDFADLAAGTATIEAQPDRK